MLSKLLELLVLEEQARKSENTRELDSLRITIERQRRKLRQKAELINGQSKSVEELVKHRIVFEVFAGLGNEMTGATVDEIQARTRLTTSEITLTCDILLRHGYIEKKEARFYANSNNVDFKNLGFSPNFAQAFSEEANHVAKNSKKLVSSESALCMYGAFSIDLRKQSEFKDRLRELLLEFMDEAEDDDGSKVAKICCAFY